MDSLIPQENDLTQIHLLQKDLDATRKSLSSLFLSNEIKEERIDVLERENKELRERWLKDRDDEVEVDAKEVLCLKVRVMVMLRMLERVGVTRAQYAAIDIARLIAAVVGSTEHHVDKLIREGLTLTPRHRQQVDRANALLTALSLTSSPIPYEGDL